MRAKRNRKFFLGIGWVTPKKGYCWTIKGDRVRQYPLPAWGSRKFGASSIAEDQFT